MTMTRDEQEKCIPPELAAVPFVPAKGCQHPRETLYDIVMPKHVTGGNWAEFGVGHGGSCLYLSKWLPPDGRFVLFDSFDGLPEPWDCGHVVKPAGSYNAGSVFRGPDARYKTVAGLFADTLPYDFGGPLDFVHIDCDLYSSTVTVLAAIDPYLRQGTLLLFDEIYGYPTYENHEWRAFNEWHAARTRSVQWLGRTMGRAACLVQ